MSREPGACTGWWASRDAPEVRYAWSGNGSLAFQVFGDGPVDLVYLHWALLGGMGLCFITIVGHVLSPTPAFRLKP